ncbi:glutathione S-transferase T3-like [Cornus florida]|uniref:glutathione S-transferase T3-like n=1 Tax=Cornus florida TaxID=4283 RepID=UPI002898D877|nr:glutathione S-transferase T3-like [Cornus florida]
MKCCGKYSGCLRQIENRQQSGIGETDKVLQAKNLYYENEKKHFTLDHCWAILKHGIKWEDLGSSKKLKSPAMTPYSSSASQIPKTSISLDSDQDPIEKSVNSPRTKRPSGRKAGKEACRKSKIADTSDSRFCDLMEKFNENTTEGRMKKFEIEERKVKVMEQMYQMEQEEKEAKEKERDDKIMMIDLSNMDPQAKVYYQLRKNEILAKLQARSTNFDYYVPLPPSPP